MKKIFISLIILILITPLSAQLNFTNYAHQNEIDAMAEEGNYIWIGTNGGLLKRNKSTGALVSKYMMKDGLVYNHVQAITIDHLGNKWIGTAHGVSYYDGTTWTSYYTEDGLKTNDVRDIVIDLEGNVWFGTSGGVTMFDGTSWTSYTISSVMDITVDLEGTIWGASWGSGKGLFKIENEVLTTYDTGNSGILSNSSMCVAVDHEGNIWCGHFMGDGVSIFDGSNWTYITGLGTYVYDIEVDAIGNKWISRCCGAISIYKYNKDNALVANYGTPELIYHIVQDILIDDQGNKWFGTHKGLSRYDDNNWSSFYIPYGLSENDVMGIDLHPDGSIWFGTMNGIYVLDEDNWSHHEDLNLSNNETYDVWIDSPINIWAGTTRGAAHYNGSIWTGYTVANTGGQLADDYVYAVAVDKNGIIWLGTGSGISLTDGMGGWTPLLTGVWIHDIIIDNHGDVWVATHGNGIYKFTLSSYPPPSENFTTADGLQTNNIYSLACDQDGKIWIGCQNNGIAYYDGNINPVSPVGVSFYNSINAITVDDLNNIWFAGDYRGILKYDGSDWVVYDGSDGLTNNNTNDIIADASQNIWVGTVAGISKISCVVPDPGFENNIACHPAATSFTNISGNVDNATKYQWDIDANGSVEYTTKDINHNFPSHGNYSVKLTAINDHCQASTTDIVNVNSMPQASIDPQSSTTICDGTTVTLEALIANYDGSLSYTYLWNTGATSSTIAVGEAGSYSVTVAHEECEHTPSNENVDVIFPYNNPEICMVSVDDETYKNMIIWERDEGEDIVSYNIYKLFGNNFTPVGEVPYDDLSVYVDYSSNPEAVAARYAISITDICGNESDISPYHQTIHLGASEGALANQIELDWTEYVDESGGFIYPYFYIFRGSSIANLALYDSVSSAFTAYTDLDAQGNIYYRVGVKSPSLCSPEGNLKAGAGPYSHSLSNVEDNRLQSGVNETPTDITLDNNTIDEEVTVSSLVGRLITSDPNAEDQHTYTLVSGTGDTDNESFIIVSDLLLSAEEFDWETKSSYSIRIRTTDNGTDNLYYEESFTITINNISENGSNLAPANITIDNSSIDENTMAGTMIGRFSSTDPNPDDNHAYTFISGAGDTDNSSFAIAGNLLLSAEIFDFETKSSYSIRVKSTDDGTGNLNYEKVFTITVIDQIDVRVEDREAEKFLIYPIPFRDMTILEFSNPDEEEFRLTVMDLTGKVVRLAENITTDRYELKREDLPAGYYFIELRGSRIYRSRVIIE